MDEMAQKLAVNGIVPNKSSISRVEAGKTSEKTMIEPAKNIVKHVFCRQILKSQTNVLISRTK